MILASRIFINWTKGNHGSYSVLILQRFNTCKLPLGPEICHLQKFEEHHQSSQECFYHLILLMSWGWNLEVPSL